MAQDRPPFRPSIANGPTSAKVCWNRPTIRSTLASREKASSPSRGPREPLYTRNGNFRFDPKGALVTNEGYPLLQQDGQPFQANPSRPVQVSRDGEITQDGISIGRMKLAEFPSTSGLTKQGSNYFQNNTGQDPSDATGAQVLQGKIESSNVSAPQGAVRLVSLMRQFEMMQKAIMLSNDMGKKAIEDVAKV